MREIVNEYIDKRVASPSTQAIFKYAKYVYSLDSKQINIVVFGALAKDALSREFELLHILKQYFHDAEIAITIEERANA